MSKNDWTDKLRDQLDGYQEPSSCDLWAGIEQSLVQQGILQDDKLEGMQRKIVPEKQKRSAIISFRRWSIAASLGLLAVGGGIVYLHSRHDSPSLSIRNNAPADGRRNDAATDDKATLPNDVNTPGAVFPACSEKLSLARLEENASLWEEEKTSVYSGEYESEKTGDVTASAEKAMAPVGYEPKPALGSGAGSAGGSTHNRLSNHRKLGCSVMLFAENIAGGGGSTISDNVMVMSEPVANFFNKEAYVLPVMPLRSVAPYADARHHAPLAVGLQVGIGVSPRVSLSTGVVYMRVASEFKTFGSPDYDVRQVLHYVGVPVSVNYKLWGAGGFHAYVTAGAEADVNVKNDTEQDGQKVENAKRDRVQFAGKASLGVQYDITRQVGLYVEPGARYNFDNGSEIENTFKEKKWNFNFQFGLRVNLE